MDDEEYVRRLQPLLDRMVLTGEPPTITEMALVTGCNRSEMFKMCQKAEQKFIFLCHQHINGP